MMMMQTRTSPTFSMSGGAAGRCQEERSRHGKRTINPSTRNREKILLSSHEFQLFRDLIKQRAGIALSEDKIELLKARLTKILRRKGLRNFREYHKVVSMDASGAELSDLLDAITTNLTSFFRESKHLDFLTRKAMPDIMIRRRRDTDRTIRIWSAGCSSGEEPYSIAMTLLDTGFFSSVWRLSISATDLCTDVLAKAEKGIYEHDRISTVPPPLLKKFFKKGINRASGFVRVKREIRQHVCFSRLNLMEAFPWREPIDVIFCRNVMIYFDKSTQERLINQFYRHLRDGGYLFIGHSESLTGIRHNYRYVCPTVYQK